MHNTPRHLHTPTHAQVATHLLTDAHTPRHTHTHIYSHTPRHTHTHTHTHTHMHSFRHLTHAPLSVAVPREMRVLTHVTELSLSAPECAGVKGGGEEWRVGNTEPVYRIKRICGLAKQY